MNQGKRIRVLAASIAALALVSLGGCIGQARSKPTGAASDVSGSFSATARGFNGDVTVTLTIGNGTLVDAAAVGEDETPAVGGRALELMPGNMVAGNTVDVDIVSGATYTSKAILAAAADALSRSGAALSARAVSVEQHMVPGTYYGEAYGKWPEGSIEGERFGSPAVIVPTKVAVTVDETRILSVAVERCSDTPGFIEPCIARIPASVVAEQSVAVDAVTGATMTSQAILTGVTAALKEAGHIRAGFSRPAKKSAASESYDTDLVIVGAGGAGTVAAIEAMEAGLRVIVLEKCGKVGGTSVCSTGFAAIGSQLQKGAGKGSGTVDGTFRTLMDYCKWRANGPLVHAVLSASAGVADKLQSYWKRAGNPGVVRVNEVAHDTGKGTEKYGVLYDRYLLPSGVRLMLETTADSLIMDGDAVVGVTAEKQDGTKVVVKAKAVLVCTGGFGGNDEMLTEYFGHDNFYLNGLSTNTGDGIRMCLAAGASLSEEIEPHLAEYTGNKKVDFYAGYMKFINQAGFLTLDSAGQRFMNEELFITQHLAYGASALRRVGYAYIVFTQDQLDAMVKNGIWGVLGKDTIKSLAMRERIVVPSYYTLAREMDEAIAAGEGWKADTLDALGEAIGFVDQESYRESMDDYLRVLATGKDPLFGKRVDLMPDLDNGPYYAVRVVPPIDGTFNGIRVNDKMQALSREGYQPISGLYVAGQDSGGYFSYPYYEGAGWTQGYALTSGAVAARSIAKRLGK